MLLKDLYRSLFPILRGIVMLELLGRILSLFESEFFGWFCEFWWFDYASE